jgi:hypothetical protein
MKSYQVCEELRDGSYIMHEEFESLEEAVAFGLSVKINHSLDIYIFTMQDNEDILNIHKL